MLQAEIFSLKDLPNRDRDAWLALRKATPAFQSPLLGPDFAEAVAQVRTDAAVAVWRRDGQAIGFLAHHRRPAGLARPIGSPFSDYHALITAPGETLDVAEALRAARITAFRYGGLIDPYNLFAVPAEQQDETYRIAFQDSGEAYWESLRAQSPKRFKNLRRLEHKLDREVATPVFGPDRDIEAFDQILAWKRDQFRRTGLHDVLQAGWSDQLMRNLFHKRDGALQGLLLTLRLDGKPIAGHFGVQEGEAYHPWIAAFDPEFSAFSPGQIFLSEAVRAMPGLGIAAYDLSAGADHYKKPFASHIGVAGTGVARGRPTAFTLDRAVDLAGAALGPAKAQTLQRARRRFDHIAATEITLKGRVQGIVTALAASSRRLVPEAH